MKKEDLEYICTTMGNLSGIPIRIYEGEEEVFYHSMVKLPRDPMQVCRDRIREVTEHVGYIVTDLFHYYGIVNAGQTKIVVGPAFQIPGKESELRQLAFRADVPADEVAEFVQGIRGIIPLPLESLLQMLCAVNFMLSGEKLQLKDLTIHEPEQERLRAAAETQRAEALAAVQPETIPHNSWSMEQTLLAIVRKGDTAALQQWAANAPAIRSGVMAADQLRQLRNTFVVSATLVSRSAIRGGMDVDDAFTLSDNYIQHCEKLSSPEKIMNLQYSMLLEYTQRVERLRRGAHESRLAVQVANYVQHHLSEPISTEELARELFLSRTHLSARFHKETGETLACFIRKEKMEEAKRLLRYSDKPMTAISSYLGFSSPGHFAGAFKKVVGIAPTEYRAKHNA